jgi:hypothetical protein
MNRLLSAAATLAALALASAASAQAPAATAYQQQPNQAFRFAGDTLARYEWTRDLPSDGELVNESRYRLQARPRIEMHIGPVELGVGGDFNYSDDKNYETTDGSTPTLIRDNYRSRDARLDLAYAKVTAGPLTAQGGRFSMPIPLTEMIWDKDLRPQGGAATIQLGKTQSPARLSLHGIYALGSSVWDDSGDFRDKSLGNVHPTTMYGGGAELSLGRPGETTLDVLGAYLEFHDMASLEPAIRRQNTRVAGLIVNQYHVFDIVGRVSRGGQLPLQLVGDFCWNTEVDQDNKGMWLALVLGATGVSRAQLEFVYSKVDKDATLAAYNTDDFLWGTGWEGYRVDLGLTTREKNSIHGIWQHQRFKDSSDASVADQWVTRYRIEWRTRF